MMAITLSLVVLFICFGSDASSHPVFLMSELLINLIIVTDLLFRIKLAGSRRFFNSWVNVLDFLVICGCIFFFLLLLIPSSLEVKLFEELTEEILYIVWAVWQNFRLVMFFKRQRQA